MPQMAPMYWLILMAYFSVLVVLSFVKLHFND